MPKNIPGIVQKRKQRQEASVEIRVQPPQLLPSEPIQSSPLEPAPQVNATPQPGSMIPSSSVPSMPTNIMPTPPSLAPNPQSQSPMPPMVERAPVQEAPIMASEKPSAYNNETTNRPFKQHSLSNRFSGPTTMGISNPPTPLPPFAAANSLTPPPPFAVSNPPTPLPPFPAGNSLTPKPTLPVSEPLSPSGPISEPLTHKQIPQQGQPPRARILIELDGKVSGEVLLQKSTLSVGRLSGSDIYIASKRISRQHAKIVIDQGAWIIEDAGSVNGIMYQGSHIKRHSLSHGDRIHLAPDVSLLYEIIH